MDSCKVIVGDITRSRKDSLCHNLVGDLFSGGEDLGVCCRSTSSSISRDDSSDQIELSRSDLSLAREHVAGEVRVSIGVIKSGSNPDSQVSGSGHTKPTVFVDVGLVLSAEIVSSVRVCCLEGSESNSLSLGRDVEAVGSVDDVGVHEVLEILGVHLVSDLRERLPRLQEGRQVVHLPPEVEALVVQSHHFRVRINGVLERVVLLVDDLVSVRSSIVDNSIYLTLSSY